MFRAARERAELSREALAYGIGVSVSTITRTELEGRLPRFSTVVAICKRLNLSLDDVARAEAGASLATTG